MDRRRVGELDRRRELVRRNVSERQGLRGEDRGLDGDGNGGCDRLVVEAPFSLGGMPLRVPDFSRIAGYVSEVASAEELEGAFASDNIVNRKSWKVRYSATSAALVHASGTMVILIFR